jgi:hypothetical protein
MESATSASTAATLVLVAHAHLRLLLRSFPVDVLDLLRALSLGFVLPLPLLKVKDIHKHEADAHVVLLVPREVLDARHIRLEQPGRLVRHLHTVPWVEASPNV